MADTAAAGVQEKAPLDDIMLAMDVVDTLRHREHVVDRELSEDVREANLIERLKEIYKAQGIEVPERILKEGVQGLKEARFTYEPPAQSLQTLLARVYVSRLRWGKVAGIAVVALAVLWAGYTFGYRLPAERRAEAARIELSEEIPSRLSALADEVESLALEKGPRDSAERLRDDGIAAAKSGDRAVAMTALQGLENLKTSLAQEYVVRVVQGDGEQSGIWRIPDLNPDARNYYLIVEAVDSAGNRISVPIRNEETGQVATVARWGQRVPERAFEAVRRDKSDDGIIQNDVIGEKRRGLLDPEYSVPVEDGAITNW